IEADVITIARSQIGHMNWKRKATPKEAPKIFNCSTFIKWVWAQKGVWLPRRAIQQREFGIPVSLASVQAGDSIFVAGYHACYYNNPEDGVGHVGILTNAKSVIHAGGKKKGVNEISLEDFLKSGEFRGARRYNYDQEPLYTFEYPPEREVEWSDDFRWLILENL
ncbi:MAG: NlpC/P60 family protein, partial [bacterium]|nr:NlpC/P60 family protein [bacterium]